MYIRGTVLADLSSSDSSSVAIRLGYCSVSSTPPAMTKGRARVPVLVLVGYRYRYSTTGTVLVGYSTVLDLASTATVYSSYLSAAP